MLRKWTWRGKWRIWKFQIQEHEERLQVFWKFQNSNLDRKQETNDTNDSGNDSNDKDNVNTHETTPRNDKAKNLDFPDEEHEEREEQSEIFWKFQKWANDQMRCWGTDFKNETDEKRF